MRMANRRSSNANQIKLEYKNHVTGDSYGEFDVNLFVKAALDTFVGKSEGRHHVRSTPTSDGSDSDESDGDGVDFVDVPAEQAIWKPDMTSDRMFVFSMAAISGVTDPVGIKQYL